jgi:plasmid stability protein
MEAKSGAILTGAVARPGEAPGLLQAIMDRFGELGGAELGLPPRDPARLVRTSQRARCRVRLHGDGQYVTAGD